MTHGHLGVSNTDHLAAVIVIGHGGGGIRGGSELIDLVFEMRVRVFRSGIQGRGDTAGRGITDRTGGDIATAPTRAARRGSINVHSRKGGQVCESSTGTKARSRLAEAVGGSAANALS